MRLFVVIVAALALLWAGGPAAAGAKAPARPSAKGCPATKKQAARKRCARSRAALRYVAGRGVARGAAGAGLAGALGTVSAGAGTGGSAGSGGPAAPGDPGAGAPGGVPAVTSTLGVEARDISGFILRLTRTAVPAGSLTIYFRNYDSSEHNLSIEPPAGTSVEISGDVGEGLGATKTVSVTPGTWRLYCSLAGHDSMTRDLAVL